MPKTIAYMLTWNTYGTWLQGDKRGFAKNGATYPINLSLEECNCNALVRNPVKLSTAQCALVRDVILEKAEQLNQRIYALSVSPCHVHIVAAYTPKPIGRVVMLYKNAAQFALRNQDLTGRIWTRGYDKRFCFNLKSLRARINYVAKHPHAYVTTRL